MNSKKALDILMFAWLGRRDDKDYPDFDDIHNALYHIEQDLEVLEIIKKHLIIFGLSISCFIGGNPNVKETYEPKFNNLKEWLENDR